MGRDGGERRWLVGSVGRSLYSMACLGLCGPKGPSRVAEVQCCETNGGGGGQPERGDWDLSHPTGKGRDIRGVQGEEGTDKGAGGKSR